MCQSQAHSASSIAKLRIMPEIRVHSRQQKDAKGAPGNKNFLFDEPLAIFCTGFPPQQTLTLRAKMQYCGWGDEWESWASFETDENGNIDLTRQSPLAGTYGLCDADGLFWSMKITKPYQGKWNDHLTGFEPTPITLTAESNGKPIASAHFNRINILPGIKQRTVNNNGIVGVLFEPPGDGPHPVVIVLSGSDGGIWKNRAALLASHGFASLALGYFGTEGLPKFLENIPLEYFSKAIEWIQDQRSLDANHLAIMGVSRGAELALLLGSTYKEIGAIVAYVPSGIIWPGWKNWSEKEESKTKQAPQPTVAWTLQGKRIPCLTTKSPKTTWSLIDSGKKAGKPFSSKLRFMDTINQAQDLEHVSIKVEKINGPILLISGDDDQIWPSSLFCNMIISRLKKANFRYHYTLLSYPNAGHYISAPYHPTTGTTEFQHRDGLRELLGGTAQGNAHAGAKSWPQVLEFLRKTWLSTPLQCDRATVKH